jgi:hypothetical protein
MSSIIEINTGFILLWCFWELLLIPAVWLILFWRNRVIQPRIVNSVTQSVASSKIQAFIFAIIISLAILISLFWLVPGAIKAAVFINLLQFEFFKKCFSLIAFFLLWVVGCVLFMEMNIRTFRLDFVSFILSGLLYTVICYLITVGIMAIPIGYIYAPEEFWICFSILTFNFRFQIWRRGI